MKTLYCCLAGAFLLLVVFSTAAAQLLNAPESVEYDALRDRYLVSNWNSGHLIQIDSGGIQDYFIVNQHCYAGLKIVGDSIYVACRGEGVRGFDLETGQMFFHLEIQESSVLNDITADNAGNLYVSDSGADKIFKVNVSGSSYTIFVSSGLSVPNGIYFDEPNNRLLLVSARNMAPLQAVDLADSSLTTLAYTGISILDGVTMDEERNVYFSAWSTNSVYKYDSTFTNPPEPVSSHNPSPADIFYDNYNDLLAVPVFFRNYIEFVDITPNSGVLTGVRPPVRIDVINYPNPFNGTTTVNYQLAASSYLRIGVFDMLGRKIATLYDGIQAGGFHNEKWDSGNAVSGIYFLRIESDDNTVTRKMNLLK